MPTLPTYDETKVSSLSLSQSQIGTDDSGTWADITLPTATLANIGLSFDFSINNDSVRGLALAPRLPFTNATNDLAGTGETATTWTLTIQTGELTTDAITANLYGVVSTNPSAWTGTTLLPSVDLATIGSTYLIEAVTSNSSTWVLSSGNYNLVWNFSFLTNYTETVAGATIISPQAIIINDSLWTGLIQFILVPSSTIEIFGVSFAGQTQAWHTGAYGFDTRERGRVVHDYITGQTYLSTEAVPDGYRDGIMVHPDNYDPPDPLDTNSYTPPPNEGVVDDDIIDVEN